MWPVLVIVALLALWGAGLYWRWHQVGVQGPQIYAAKRETGELGAHVSESAFLAAYRQHEGPRAETHVYAAGLIVGLGLAPFVWAFNTVWRALWRANGAPPVYETGTMIHTFLVFIAILAFIFLTGYIAMRRYYRAPAGNLRRAVEQLNKSA